MSASVPWHQPPDTHTSHLASSVAPAYMAVHARRAFARPEAKSAAAPAHVKVATSVTPQKVEWPPSVRQYVQRSLAYASSFPKADIQKMERKLKQVITKAIENQMLYVIDWDKHLLPDVLIKDEEDTAAATAENTARRIGETAEQMVWEPSGGASKKRKSPNTMDHADDPPLPPWRKTNKKRLRNASERAGSPGVIRSLAERMDSNHISPSPVRDEGNGKYGSDAARIEMRQQRFFAASQPPRDYGMEVDQAESTADGPLVGLCQDLEKPYLRLTATPKAEAVRPLHVLEKTLQHLKQKWKDESNYVYICDQLKSVRQDLTVQHIKTEFTVSVYEIHARIALEKGDMGEFNQCQTQLRILYARGLGGHPVEFLAYSILYLIYTGNRIDMNDFLAELTPQDKLQPAVKHALDVRSALALNNYHWFSKLYFETPNMGMYLIDMFIARERPAAMARISKAYKSPMHLSFLTKELAFESRDECRQFLREHDCNFVA